MELLSRDYPIKDVCAIMGVSRAGYYKWKRRGKSTRAIDREKLLADVRRVHADHSTHGYRWVAAYLRINENGTACDNVVYKCFRCLGITSSTRHRVKYKPRKVKDRYPNLIFSTWDTVDRPRQVIVSDMTAFRILWMYVEVTFYFDVFTKEIVTHRCGDHRGDRNQYIDGLEDVKCLLKGQTEPCVLHTDAVRRTSCRSTDCNSSGTKARKCTVLPSENRFLRPSRTCVFVPAKVAIFREIS